MDERGSDIGTGASWMRPSPVLPSSTIILDPHTPTTPILQMRKPRLRKEKPLAQSHTSSSSHLQVRAGKEDPRVSVGEGGLPRFIGQQAAGEGRTGGGWGCNNLKTGGESGSSSGDLCRGEGPGVFTRICTKCPAPAWGRKGGFEQEGMGRGRNLPL